MQDVLEDVLGIKGAKAECLITPQRRSLVTMTLQLQIKETLHQSLEGKLVEGMKKRIGSKLARNLLRSERKLCNGKIT